MLINSDISGSSASHLKKPNHAYDYGEHILAISLPAQSVAPGFDASAHHVDAIAKAQPYIDALAADRGLRLELLFNLLPLLGAEQPTFSVEQEGHYAHWLTGTMDFLMAPLPLDDGAHTVSKVLSLWGMATPGEASAAGMPDEQLAWTGGAKSLVDFLDGFVAIGDGAGGEWTHERLSPLQEYLLSLVLPRRPHHPLPRSSPRAAPSSRAWGASVATTVHGAWADRPIPTTRSGPTRP